MMHNRANYPFAFEGIIAAGKNRKISFFLQLRNKFSSEEIFRVATLYPVATDARLSSAKGEV